MVNSDNSYVVICISLTIIAEIVTVACGILLCLEFSAHTPYHGGRIDPINISDQLDHNLVFFYFRDIVT